MYERFNHAILHLEEELRILRDVQRQLREESPSDPDEQQQRIRQLHQLKVEIYETVDAVLVLRRATPATRARAVAQLKTDEATELYAVDPARASA